MDGEASRGTPGVGNWRPPFRHGTAVLILTRAAAEEPLLMGVAPAAVGTEQSHGPVAPGPAMVDDRLVVERVQSGRPDVGDRARRSPVRLGLRERLWCWRRRR